MQTGDQSQSSEIESFPKQASVNIAEPTISGTSMTLLGGRPLWRYVVFFTLGVLLFYCLNNGVQGIMVPNQVQSIVFSKYFTGADANVNLTALANLKNAVANGAAASPEQQRLLGLYNQFDISRAQAVSMVATVGIIATIILVLIFGVISDRTRSRLGRRNFWIFIGAILTVLSTLLLRYAPSVALIAIGVTIVQGSANISLLPLNATIADRVPESRRGILSSMLAIGMVVGGLLGTYSASIFFPKIGLDFYYVLAVAFFVASVLFVIFARDRPSTDLQLEPFKWSAFFKGYLISLSDRDFRLVWIARFVLFFGYLGPLMLLLYIMQSYIHPALSAAEATELAPLLALITAVCSAITTLLSGPLSDKIGRRKPFVIISSIMLSIGMFIPLVWPTLTAIFVSSAISGIGYGTYISIDQALFIDVLPDKNAAGRDLAVANIAINLAQALGPILAGLVVTMSGGYGMVYAVAGILTLVAAFIIVPVKRAR